MGAEADQEAAGAARPARPSGRSSATDIEKTNSKQKIKDLTKRLKMVEAIRNSRATSPSGWSWT